MAGRLYDIQPEDREPIEFTHFDCWGDDDEGFSAECLYDPDNFEPASDALCKVMASWNESLGSCVDGFVGAAFGDSHYQALCALGFELFMDLVVLNVLRAGYDVYEGDGFIEIYAPTDWE